MEANMKRVLSVLVVVFVLATAALPCAAATGVFAPSVTRKGAPEIVTHDIPGGGECIADLVDSKDDGTVIHTPKDYLIVTPYGEKDDAPNIGIKNMLEDAYSDIGDIESIPELDKELDKRAAELRPDADSGDLVAYELFNIAFITEQGEYFEKSGKQMLRVVFDTDTKDEETKPIIIYKPEGSDWMVVDSENVVLNDDGTITVYFESVGTVVFLRLSSESEDTGISRNFYIWLIILIASAVTLAFVVGTGRKKAGNID